MFCCSTQLQIQPLLGNVRQLPGVYQQRLEVTQQSEGLQQGPLDYFTILQRGPLDEFTILQRQ